MPLPWRKKQIPAIVSPRKPEGLNEEETHSPSGLAYALSDLARAFEAHDFGAAAEAFTKAFQIAEMQPHEEASHTAVDEFNDHLGEGI